MLSEGHIAVPATGMGAIPAQLADAARAAGARIDFDSEVTAVEPAGTGRRESDASGGGGEIGGVTVALGGETVDADAAVVATDPPTARALTGVDSVPTDGRGCATQYYALPESVGFDPGTRLHLNLRERGPNHVAPLSAVAPEYAPPGRQSLSATFLGRPDADDAALAERTREALASWYPGVAFDDLALGHTDRIRFAQFDQPPGVHAGLPGPDAPDGPVYLAGDYTGWSSIQAALRSGQRAAAVALADRV